MDDIQNVRRVKINDIPKVHMMFVWDFAYRDARKGHWHIYTIDRMRFKRRIDAVAPVINVVLDEAHRAHIKNSHYKNDTD